VVNYQELYINHGLHLNWRGKEVMMGKIVNVIKDILNVHNLVPIVMKWKEEKRTGPIQPENCETPMGKDVQCLKDTKDNTQVINE
jgi:hypothetical protein